jgi:predicted O-linked N-acetylglucosamine transferase (SPINDLY family)
VLSWWFPRKRAASHFQEGIRLAQAGRIAAAAVRLRRAAELRPDFAEAHFNLGSACRDLGRLEDAAAAYRRAAELKPDSADPWLSLGATLRELGRLEEAVEALKRALALNPSLAEARQELGNAHTALGNWREALEQFRSAAAASPDDAAARWAGAMAQIPAIPESAEQAAAQRLAFDAALADLERALRGRAGAHAAVAVHQPFYLAYQEEDNRELMARYGRLSAELMRGWQASAGLAAPAPRVGAAPLRVGIASAQVHNHSVWTALVRGWIGELDAARFEVHLFSLGARSDAETRAAAARAEEFHAGPRPFQDWARLIHESELDVLVYPEIGMDATTAKLAAMRLAPVQAASWGHPHTSGLPTIDYFISAEDLEPPGAQAHYTEKLVLLPHTGCTLSKSETVAARTPQVEGEGPLLLCPGTPFKYAPQFDAVLVEIARRLGKCRLAFFTATPQALSHKLRQRLERAGLDFTRHARFLPWLAPGEFRALMASADLYLDTIGFSGFNTALQAVEAGLPVLTREGRFLRGRLASGILRRIAVDELVVPTEQAYVELAVALSGNRERRETLKKAIEAKREVLFNDPAPVAALQEFLLRAR